VSLGLALGSGLGTLMLIAAAGASVSACYEIPRPACGFLCGPQSACPDGYACATDGYCHRLGEPADLVCAPIDGPLPPDASPLDAAPPPEASTLTAANAAP
jgi:hypothetical protein